MIPQNPPNHDSSFPNHDGEIQPTAELLEQRLLQGGYDPLTTLANDRLVKLKFSLPNGDEVDALLLADSDPTHYGETQKAKLLFNLAYTEENLAAVRQSLWHDAQDGIDDNLKYAPGSASNLRQYDVATMGWIGNLSSEYQSLDRNEKSLLLFQDKDPDVKLIVVRFEFEIPTAIESWLKGAIQNDVLRIEEQDNVDSCFSARREHFVREQRENEQALAQLKEQALLRAQEKRQQKAEESHKRYVPEARKRLCEIADLLIGPSVRIDTPLEDRALRTELNLFRLIKDAVDSVLSAADQSPSQGSKENGMWQRIWSLISGGTANHPSSPSVLVLWDHGACTVERDVRDFPHLRVDQVRPTAIALHQLFGEATDRVSVDQAIWGNESTTQKFVSSTAPFPTKYQGYSSRPVAGMAHDYSTVLQPIRNQLGREGWVDVADGGYTPNLRESVSAEIKAALGRYDFVIFVTSDLSLLDPSGSIPQVAAAAAAAERCCLIFTPNAYNSVAPLTRSCDGADLFI